MGRAAALALLASRLALAGPDGGYLDVCPDASDAGPAVAMDGGYWLPTPRGERLACRLSGCEEALRQAEAQPVATPVAVVVAAAVGLALGAVGGGYLVWSLRR